MKDKSTYQIVISGVGGQGVLFITRLLAEAAIEKRMPVFTSETHGMAQRGGTVISHVKVGDFASPLIHPGRGDGLIALKAENLAQHGGYLKPGGWAAVNSPRPPDIREPFNSFFLDADRLAQGLGSAKALNLIMLGFALACAERSKEGRNGIHCSVDDVAAVLKTRLKGKGKGQLLETSINALRTGAESARGMGVTQHGDQSG